MSDRMYQRNIATPNTSEVRISGSFAPNGSSALVSTSTYGKHFTAAYTSTGLYTLTFADVFPKLLSFHVTLQLASGDDKVLQVGTYTAASKTITIRCWDISAAAVADIAADANNRIHFEAVFSNSNTD